MADLADAAPQALRLAPDQLRKLAQAVAVAVADALRADVSRAGRSSYSIAEVAERAGVGETTVRDDVRAGLLRVVRPGGRSVARVLPQDELAWLQGQRTPTDPPVTGISPAVAERRRIGALVDHIVRPRVRKTVHRA